MADEEIKKVKSEKDLVKEQEKIDKERITLDRYRIAVEKMQLSWLRKSLIISFLGMTLYKIFEAETDKGKALVFGFIGATEIGLFMLFTGFLFLVMATKDHIKTVEKVKGMYTKYDEMPRSYSLQLSYVILFVTLFLFLATLSHYGSKMFVAN
jgi:uncharacterized membrane protein YidH (DUF202 family)